MSKIPPLFHSFEHDEPFQSCLTCEQAFESSDHPYTVTKVFRGNECIFEYAMCLPCRQKIGEEFSPESRQYLKNFFDENFDLATRSEKLVPKKDPDTWIQHCGTCHASLRETKNYSLACMGFGQEMVYDPFPIMICADCESRMQEGLSKKTRDQWDRFISDHFEGPPADSLKPDGVPMLA